MNIIKELELFKSSKDFGDTVIEYIKAQEKELQQKKYMFKAIAFSSRLKSLVFKKLFEEDKIKYIGFQFKSQYNNHSQLVYGVRYFFLDENRGMVSAFIDKESRTLTPSALAIDELFEDCELTQGLPKDLVSSNINNSDKFVLELNREIYEQMLGLLLSNNLKNIYEYSKLQLELSTDNEDSPKRVKV